MSSLFPGYFVRALHFSGQLLAVETRGENGALASYLLMGWLMVVVAPQLTDVIGTAGMIWLVAGGVCYSVGAIFYAKKQMHFSHAIWHVFVLAGAACHFLAVVWYVLPDAQVV